MNSNQQKIEERLNYLVANQNYQLIPATQSEIALFKNRATAIGVPELVIAQLIDLYSIADNFEYKIVLSFYSCKQDIIFQNWHENELLLGKKDFNVLRWKYNKFCLGDDIGNISISEDYEFNTLIELIECCIKEIDEINE